MMPPPNVTGSLHMGHALTFTLQDILIRYQRMRGLDTLWQPGTDHAGIATQMVVERQLAAKGIVLDRPGAARQARRRTSRPSAATAFIAKVWEWKAESGGTITRQLRRLGASPDWPRERFTMDEGLSHAVRKVFVDLHKQGLIYRDKRLVNWDPKLHTAISDLEVQNREVKGHLWHIRYPIEGEPERHIVIATTRPETMLGDTAVAVHPEDARYAISSARRCCCRWSAARSRSSPTTMPIPRPAAARSRSRRPTTSTISRSAAATTCRASTSSTERRINENAPEAYRGLDRFEARKRVVADLEAQGLIEKIEDAYPQGAAWRPRQRPIEPWLTDQWYVDAATLAAPAIRRWSRGAPASCRSSGPRPISSGCATSSPGASRASSGGATRSRPGTAPTARSSSR